MFFITMKIVLLIQLHISRSSVAYLSHKWSVYYHPQFYRHRYLNLPYSGIFCSWRSQYCGSNDGKLLCLLPTNYSILITSKGSSTFNRWDIKVPGIWYLQFLINNYTIYLVRNMKLTFIMTRTNLKEPGLPVPWQLHIQVFDWYDGCQQANFKPPLHSLGARASPPSVSSRFLVDRYIKFQGWCFSIIKLWLVVSNIKTCPLPV